MERGVLMGGLLISASFLLAVGLNQAAKQASKEGAHQNSPALPEQPIPEEFTPTQPSPCPRIDTDEREPAADVHTSSNCRSAQRAQQ